MEWQRRPLLAQRDALAGVGDFDALHGGDVDHVEPTDDVATLLARLTRLSEEGEQWFEVVRGKDATTVRGALSTHAAYRELRFPLLYAASAANAANAALGDGLVARLSLLGELEGEIVIVLADVDANGVRLSRVDPQNFSEDDWQERSGGLDVLEVAWAKWRKKARRRAR